MTQRISKTPILSRSRGIITLLIFFTTALASCGYGELKVSNQLAKVKISQVNWGPIFVEYQLLPGQTSQKVQVYSSGEVDLPESHFLSFYLEYNGAKVYLETIESFRLKKDQQLEIIIDSTTLVSNPLTEKSLSNSTSGMIAPIGMLLKDQSYFALPATK
jgi:hypothetical protein